MSTEHPIVSAWKWSILGGRMLREAAIRRKRPELCVSSGLLNDSSTSSKDNNVKRQERFGCKA